jgi:hypothetical protein
MEKEKRFKNVNEWQKEGKKRKKGRQVVVTGAHNSKPLPALDASNPRCPSFHNGHSHFQLREKQNSRVANFMVYLIYLVPHLVCTK